MNSDELLWILKNYYEYQRIPMDYNEILMNYCESNKNSYEFIMILNDYNALYRINMNS